MAEDLVIDKTDDVNGILLKNRKDVESGRSGRESRNDFSKGRPSLSIFLFADQSDHHIALVIAQ